MCVQTVMMNLGGGKISLIQLHLKSVMYIVKYNFEEQHIGGHAYICCVCVHVVYLATYVCVSVATESGRSTLPGQMGHFFSRSCRSLGQAQKSGYNTISDITVITNTSDCSIREYGLIIV